MGKEFLQDLERRSFLKGVGLTAMGALPLGMLAACAPASAEAPAADQEPVAQPVEQPAASVSTDGGTPDTIRLAGGSTMSLYQLNQLRHEYVDSREDYICTDGTVIPAVWVKLRALVNTYGQGTGEPRSDDAFVGFQMLFSEEEAQAYLEMPYGVMFTAADFAGVSDREESDCLKICEDLSSRGLLWRTVRAGVPHYHHLTIAHGMFEYNLDHFWDEGWAGKVMTTLGSESGNLNSGTPFYYTMPCSKDVVAYEKILMDDDFEGIVKRNPVIGVSPCQCRMFRMVSAGEEQNPPIGSEELKDFKVPACGHSLETCLSFGEEAQYYIDKGIARQIDQEEALAILNRSVEEGMVIQGCFTKESEIICSCHGDCCLILGSYVAAGDEGCAASNSYPNNSHYLLNYSKDTCIKCGQCAERCPLFAIAMDDEGYPTVNHVCMRCGQCGVVCPTGSRTLVAKTEDERIELPLNLLEDYNLQAAYRFENGWIGKEPWEA